MRIWIVNWREKFDPVAWATRIGVAITTLLLVVAVIRLSDQTHDDHKTIERDRNTIMHNRRMIAKNTARVEQLERCITDPGCIAVPPVPTTTVIVTPTVAPRSRTTPPRRPTTTNHTTTTARRSAPATTTTRPPQCPNPDIVGVCPTVP